ncbi:hypothetical protein [Pedobacter sp. FW305-3-2-15-E-R2A2]|uniref:hypothetical protein n=1 Tax=Pedobacter sp. FW305-3-2-15-E-R2A2 TaxID=3140251 RepID=UPI0031403600
MNNWCLKYIPLLIMLVFLSGCGMFRKVFKSNDYAKQEISSSEKKKMKEWTTDRSILTIREQSDTIVVIPEKIIKQETSFNVDSLVNGLTVIQDDLLDVNLIFQPETGMLSASATLKPRLIPVKFNKETILQNDVSRKITQSGSAKKSSKSAQSNTIVEKSPVSTWLYISGSGILILISFSLFYWLKKRYLQ